MPTGGSRKARLVESAGYDDFDYDKSQISIHVSPGPDRLIEVVAKNGGIKPRDISDLAVGHRA